MKTDISIIADDSCYLNLSIMAIIIGSDRLQALPSDLLTKASLGAYRNQQNYWQSNKLLALQGEPYFVQQFSKAYNLALHGLIELKF